MNRSPLFNKCLQASVRRWTSLVCAAGLVWLTGCLHSLDQQLTPVITSVSPDTLTQGSIITVQGKNFSFLNAATSVALYVRQGTKDSLLVDRPAITTNTSGENLIQVSIPLTFKAGMYDIYLLVRDREGDRKSNAVSINVQAFGATSVEPSKAPAGTVLTIRGNGLNNVQKVIFSTASGVAAEVDPLSPPTKNELKVRVPEDAIPGIFYLRITKAPNPQEGLFFRVTLPPPTMTTVTPNKGPAGTKVIISGTNLGVGEIYSRKVTFTGKDKAKKTLILPATLSAVPGDNTDKQLTLFVPSGFEPGLVSVKVEIDTVLATPNSLPFKVERTKAAKYIFWADGSGAIQAAALNGSTWTVNKIFENTAYSIPSVAVDRTNDRVYFCENTSIRSVDLVGEQPTHPVSSTDIINTVKVADTHLYWQEANAKIYRANLDGSARKLVYAIPDGSDNTVYAIEVPPTEDFVYWAEISNGYANHEIRRRKSDGSGATATVFNNLIDASTTAIAVSDRLLYVFGSDANFAPAFVVGKADGSGSFTPALPIDLNAVSLYLFALDYGAKQLYWTQVDFSGSGQTEMKRRNLNAAGSGEVVFDASQQPLTPTYGTMAVF